MRHYLELMVNSQFRLMNDTYSRVTEQLSVRDAFFTHASEYMMGEMTRLVKRVEELKAPDTPGDPMEICIEDVEPILPPQNYQRRLLSGISSQVWTWKTTVPREKSRRDPYGKKGSRGNTPDPHRKRGSRASTPTHRVTSSTAIVAPQALAATTSEAPGSSLDYSEGSPAYTGDYPDPRPQYTEPSFVVQRLSFTADKLRPELPRSTSLVTIHQPVPSQTFVSRYPATVVPPPQPMAGQEVPQTPPVSVATVPGDNVGSRGRPVLLVPEIPAQRPAFNDLPQPGVRAPRKPDFPRACTICGQRQHASGVCPTLIQCDMCDGKGHYEFDCPYAKCDLFIPMAIGIPSSAYSTR